MIVVDASAIVDLLLATPRAEAAARHIMTEGADLHAPDLLDVEVLTAVRRRERRGQIAAARAGQALNDLRDLPISLYPPRGLLDRAWQLRANLTAGDGLYAALAEALDAAVLTTDGRLARALADHTSLTVLAP